MQASTDGQGTHPASYNRIDGKTITTDHPVAYVSGLFRGSQINWAALMKEAYAIYMSVKKLSFYLTDAEVLLNNKVNNWAMELEALNIKFQHVSGRTNILADTLSRLVDINPDARLDLENAGWEFGYYVFKTLPKLSSEEMASVCEVLSGTNYHPTRRRPTGTFHTNTNVTLNK